MRYVQARFVRAHTEVARQCMHCGLLNTSYQIWKTSCYPVDILEYSSVELVLNIT